MAAQVTEVEQGGRVTRTWTVPQTRQSYTRSDFCSVVSHLVATVRLLRSADAWRRRRAALASRRAFTAAAASTSADVHSVHATP